MATGIFTLRNQLLGLIQKAWTGTQKTNFVEYLVVAGGGGGAIGSTYNTGGGGAGGLLQGIVPVTVGSSITVTVGAGGTVSGLGGNSVFGSVNAIGGGYAGNAGGSGNPGVAGGSGGAGNSLPNPGGQGTSGQGNAGGGGATGGANGGGGGGGAGTVGLNGTTSAGGNGGSGIASAISGTVTAYAGGGGGESGVTPIAYGGVGGGGNGACGGNSYVATAGSANTGGGGGGGASGGSGGSGICIISYPDTYNAPTTLTGTYTASTSGSGSVYFNGSSAIAYSANSLNIRTNSFTFEGWFNFSSLSGTIGLFGSAGANTFYISYLSGNLYIGDGATNTISYPYTISTGTWYSIAVSFDGTSYRLFVNGSLLTTSTTLLANTTLTNLSIANYNSTNYFTGYVSNARYVKGTAVYTSTYTVSTIPLTAITNTSLLLNTVSGAYLADGSTNSFAVTATGSPTWNQASPFATGLGYKNRVYTWTGSGTVTF